MTAESTPSSTGTSGNLRLWFVPSGSNPLSVAILTGATAKSITYSLTPSGYNPASSQETTTDDRLTNPQKLEQPGDVTDTLEIQYIDGSPADIAITEGIQGFVVERRSIANATDATVAQKVRVFTITAGVKRPDAPAANGVFTTTHKLFITGPTNRSGVLVA